jgi:ribosomal protein L24
VFSLGAFSSIVSFRTTGTRPTDQAHPPILSNVAIAKQEADERARAKKRAEEERKERVREEKRKYVWGVFDMA